MNTYLKSTSDQCTKEMEEVLNLNDPALVRARKAMLAETMRLIVQVVGKKEWTRQMVEKYIEKYKMMHLFENCGLLGDQKAGQFIAQSGDDLRQKLTGNPGFVFSLIQKFNQPNATPIHPDHDIIVMSDEAHRTQNGVYADNMVHLLPTAHRIGFTGTPLLANDNITARTFGGYVSIYDFKRAVDDKATVPLYYENRGEKLKELKNPEINEEIAARLDEEDLSPEQQAKVEREFAQEVHLLTAEKRLRVVAHDFVRHYSDVWTSGKAMVVCFNKVTCVRMYNYAQEYWQREINLDREDFAADMKRRKDAIDAIWKELKKKRKHTDITDLSVAINEIVNEHLELDPDSKPTMAADHTRRFDISAIDFGLLHREFAKSRERYLALRDILQLLQERMARMLEANPSRIDFYEKYQEIIRAYNQEQNRASIEKTFEDLMNLSRSLTEEQKRYVREGFKTDEELAVYELLVKDNLTKPEIRKLKEVAIELLKAMLNGMDHPFDKQDTKAAIIVTIRDTLWQELPESYSDESIDFYRDRIYGYISQRYYALSGMNLCS